MKTSVSLLITLLWTASALAADEWGVGERCELTKPVRVSAKAKGKGKKVKLKPGAVLEVLDSEMRWALVTSVDVEGWIKTVQLDRKCERIASTPEPKPAPAPADPGAGAPVPAASTQLEELQFGGDNVALGGAMQSAAPEGTHACDYKSIKDCQEQCALGHAGSCHSAADQLRSRLGGPGSDDTDQRRVASLYTKACNRGHAAGCLRLGEMYERGEGVPINDRIVRQLYEKACGGGAALACTHIAFKYFGGEGVAVNLKKAAELYRRGCEGGSAQGCTGLGSMVRAGQSGKADALKAAGLFERGCNGHPTLGAMGCSNLGYMHEAGEGMPANVTKAIEFYTRGCAGGAEYACKRLAEHGAPIPAKVSEPAKSATAQDGGTPGATPAPGASSESSSATGP